jgi:hypothetical protein
MGMIISQFRSSPINAINMPKYHFYEWFKTLKLNLLHTRFQVIMAVKKLVVFWYVTPRSRLPMAEKVSFVRSCGYQWFRGQYYYIFKVSHFTLQSPRQSWLTNLLSLSSLSFLHMGFGLHHVLQYTFFKKSCNNIFDVAAATLLLIFPLLSLLLLLLLLS